MRNACQSFCMHGIWGEKRWLFVIALRGGVSIAASVALLVVQLQQVSLTVAWAATIPNTTGK